MPRYRLKFMLHEVDLPAGEALVGRSQECFLTLEDPLVSRRHARLSVAPGKVTFEDLSSRNGSMLNGMPVYGPKELKTGDRIRLGTQEFVFNEVTTEIDPRARSTGLMQMCQACSIVFPRGASSCPHCGVTVKPTVETCATCGSELDETGTECPRCGPIDPPEEDTTKLSLGLRRASTWTGELTVEVIEKAISLGKTARAQELLDDVRSKLDQRLLSSSDLDPTLLERVARCAVTLASQDIQSEGWIAWVLNYYRYVERMVPALVAADLAKQLLTKREVDVRPLDMFLAFWNRVERSLSQEELEALSTLATARRSIRPRRQGDG